MEKTVSLDQLQYPIGRFNMPEEVDAEMILDWINDIEQFPADLKETLTGISHEQLKWKYRPEGWTIAQVIHHCADSHMNGYIRFKLAMTEDEPTIKPYEQHPWSRTNDAMDEYIEGSLMIIEGLHYRWEKFLRSLSHEDLDKKFMHPEYGRRISLLFTLALYAWHGKHHLAHIRQALESEGSYN